LLPSLAGPPFGILPHPRSPHAMPFKASRKRVDLDPQRERRQRVAPAAINSLKAGSATLTLASPASGRGEKESRSARDLN